MPHDATRDNWQTPAQKKWAEQYRRKQERYTRTKNTLLLFWHVCGNRQCRRTHSCAGDANECFTKHWRLVPYDFRVWFRTTVLAYANGTPPEEASRLGREAMAKWLADNAAMNAAFAGNRATAHADAANADASRSAPVNAPPSPPMPRLRQL